MKGYEKKKGENKQIFLNLEIIFKNFIFDYKSYFKNSFFEFHKIIVIIPPIKNENNPKIIQKVNNKAPKNTNLKFLIFCNEKPAFIIKNEQIRTTKL